MKRQKTFLFIAVLLLVGMAAAVLAHAKANQRLGQPGVKTRPLPNSKNLEVLFPDQLPGYTAKALETPPNVMRMLPADTSFGQKLYVGGDGFQCMANCVLMGSSRESIHKAKVCLTAQGWEISEDSAHENKIPIHSPAAYDMPVTRLNARSLVEIGGQKVAAGAVYVYWFVNADRVAGTQAAQSMWAAHDVIFKGELDRFAYVSFFSVCAPGQEDATFERMKQLIAAAVPEFQLVPRPVK